MAAIAQPAAAAAAAAQKNEAEKKAKEQERDRQCWKEFLRNDRLINGLGLEALGKLTWSVPMPVYDNPPKPEELHAPSICGQDADKFPIIAVRCVAVKDKRGVNLPAREQKVELVFCHVHRPVFAPLAELWKAKEWHYRDYYTLIHPSQRGRERCYLSSHAEDIERLRKLIMGEEVQCFGESQHYYKKN